jgi:hypothetical protein
MAGQGGFKHRKRRKDRKRTQRQEKARDNIRRIRHKYESKGQTWEPENNPAQMAELTHDARRLVGRTEYAKL